MLEYLSGSNCVCGKQATTVVIMFREISYEHHPRHFTGINGISTYIHGEREIKGSVSLFLVCDNCSGSYDTSTYCLKAKLTEETKQELIEISTLKERHLSL